MSQSKYQADFWGDILGQEIPNLDDPYIQYFCTVWWSLSTVKSLIFPYTYNIRNSSIDVQDYVSIKHLHKFKSTHNIFKHVKCYPTVNSYRNSN